MLYDSGFGSVSEIKQRLTKKLLDDMVVVTGKYGYSRLLLVIVLASEAATLFMNTVNSYLFLDGLSVDLLMIGAVDAFFVSGSVGAGVLVLFDRVRESESRIREENVKLETVLAGMGEGVAIMDPGHRLLYQNDNHMQMLGEHIGERCYTAYHGREEPCEECPVSMCVAEGEVVKMRKDVQGDGVTRYFEVTAAPIYDVRGRLTSVVEISRDLTEVVRDELAMKESELKYRTLVELASDSIILADAQTGYILDANRMAEELLGRSLYDIIGMHLSELGPPEMAGLIEEKLRGNVEKGRGNIAGISVLHKSGRLVPVEASIAAIEVEGRKYVQGIFHDITYRMETEKQKEEFFAMLRHDMKTPLSVISGNAQNALFSHGKNLPAELETTLHTILRNSKNLVKMIDDLSVISIIESGSSIISAKPTNVYLLLLETTMDIKDRAAEKGILFTKDIPDNLPELTVDENHLKRAVLNLLQNALLYTPEGGGVTLHARSGGNGHGESVVISVSDDGPGISPEEHGRVFEKYYRAASSGGVSGSGLGLAIVKGVAEAHGGSVELVSEPGKGSRFSIILPIPPEG